MTSSCVGIYNVNDKLFFVPYAYNSVGVMTLVHPIQICDANDSVTELGRLLLSALESAKQTEPASVQNAFKDLLKITGVKSQRNLVEKAKYITGCERNNTLELKLIGVNIRRKAFMGKVNEEPQIFELDKAKWDQIGTSIKELLQQPRTLIDL